MDKNFINIDDLVRQRLAGAEERERSGAWLRMSELLEKEMPQVRPVGFIWRRMLGALSVILLIGALSLGGYELNSFVRTQSGASDAVIAAAPASTHTTADHNTAVVSNITDNKNPNSNTNPGGQSAGDNNNTNVTAATATASVDDDNKSVAGNNERAKENGARSKNDKAGKNDNGSKNVLAANVAPAKDKKTNAKSTGKQDQSSSIASADKKADDRTAANNKTTNSNTTNNKVASTNTTSANTDGNTAPKEVAANNNNKAKTGKKNTTPAPAVAVNNNVPAKENSTKENTAHKTGSNATANNTTASNTKTGSKENTTGKTKTAKAKTTDAVANVTKPAPAKTPAKKNETRGTEATTGSASVAEENTEDKVADAGNEGAKTTAPGKKTTTNKKVAVGDMALGSTTPGNVKPVNNNAHKANTTNKTAKPTVNSNTASPKATKGTNTSVAAVTTGNKLPQQYYAGNNTAGKPSNPVSKPGTNPVPAEDISMVNKKKGKRVIEKMRVFHRPVKTSGNETAYWLDTVSMGSFTEEYDLLDPAVLAVTGVPKTGNAVASSDDPDSDSSPAGKPGEKSYADSKENNFDKKTVGAKTMENLNAAFNDIKYNAAHPTFQAGIIAGINATFFGPNNFKGFQFGITGKLSFGESLSIMSELKYFHRMNNNYAVNDDYYAYTPVSGGYNKQLVLNPYIVSTLHSFEMPISVRYNIGNFGIFFGPNMVYTFGVNTGNYPITVHNPTPNIVSTPGNDNGPKLKANDFNARFGLGYLFGFSYQVTPKVMIDFRDVQTFWDNAGTDGAKAVSTKLYKAPSFQLSVAYRFGGGKSKEE